jgi:hypothetical protein
MPQATPGKWFISVICECSHRMLIFPDLTQGNSDPGRTFVRTICPDCKTEASRQIEHYQVPMVKGVSGELS